MTVYVIGLSPELQKSAEFLVGAIEASGGIPVWQNVWLIECDEHPSRKFHLLASGGAFAIPADSEAFWISIGPKCTLEARKFFTDKVYRPGTGVSGAERAGSLCTYTNNGEPLFAPIIERFESQLKEGTTSLCEIMARHGSDKGLGWHNYTQFYAVLFDSLPNPVRSVFEVGLGTNFVDVPSSMGPDGVPGASLRGWRAYFPEAMIYGGDIDRRILFNEDRIQTYFVDQLHPETFDGLWNHMPHVMFDIFIDDGLHEIEAGINTFKSCFGRVRQDGYYIIEDVERKFIHLYIDYMKTNGIDAVAIELKHIFNNVDNCLIVAAHPK